LVTIRQYYDRWIKQQKPPLVRVSRARDYRQTFTR
jgi:integrase